MSQKLLNIIRNNSVKKAMEITGELSTGKVVPCLVQQEAEGCDFTIQSLVMTL